MNGLRCKFEQLKSLRLTFQCFKNPFIICLSRFGLIKIPYFPFRFYTGRENITMLGRPATTPMADLFVLKEVFLHETYKDILPLLGSGPIKMVDVGANIGSFTVWLHRRLGVAAAHCFEPEADSFKLLSFNLAQNGCDFATAIHAALGGWARTVQVHLKETSPGGTSIYSGGDEPATAEPAYAIPVLAFDDWLRSVPGTFDLLKLDCEGAEWEILRNSSVESFARFRLLVAEVHGDPEGKQRVAEFKPAMERLGFGTVRWDGKEQGLYVGIRDKSRAVWREVFLTQKSRCRSD